MAWSDMILILQHFDNAFEVNKRLTKVEDTMPITGTETDLSPNEPIVQGKIWFKSNLDETEIKNATIFSDDKSSVSLPFVSDLDKIPIDDNLADYIDDAENLTYYDVIKRVLDNQYEIEQLEGVKLVTLSTSGWLGGAAPFSQTVSLNTMKEGMKPLIVSALPENASLDNQKIYNKAFNTVSAGTLTTGNKTVTFKVYKKPSIDVVVGLKGV